ncbi:MAG: cation diffusion facilitator CzcD-associated flavoprotein CzcO [Patiriisocius sp.]
MFQVTVKEVDVAVVGAGFAGMYMLHKLRGEGLTVQAFERGDGVGGTWYWNRYPGARCDIESVEYSYQFDDELQQEWEWNERYAPQPEILQYANHVADRFDLRPHIQFETIVVSAVFNESTCRWLVTTDKGEQYSAQWCVMATGCLSSTNLPDFEGLSDFKGDWYHTGLWPKEGVDFSGKRVAVIGTGSSAIQSIPVMAEQAETLTVFQRTANFSIPAHNGELSPKFVEQIKGDYKHFRKINSETYGGFGGRWNRYQDSIMDADDAKRQTRFDETWALGGFHFTSAFADIGASDENNKIAADYVRDKIRSLVDDAETAELLCPDQVIGCKRLCVDTGYFETFNRDSVTLVNVKDHPIEKITENGLVTNSQEYEFDIIVFATGFDAMTGSLLSINIQGREGQSLQEKWAAGPRTYLGLQIHGFPNMFTISGPGSPSVLTNMIVSIEQHVNWINRCINHVRFNDMNYMEAMLDAEDAWVAHNNSISELTLFPQCNSWYLGANVPGKPRVFMPYVAGFPAYTEKCEDVVVRGYEGFSMQKHATS